MLKGTCLNQQQDVFQHVTCVARIGNKLSRKCQMNDTFHISIHRHLLRMQIFHLFGWFWIMNFIIALGQCVLAGAFASWYFTYQKPDVSRLQTSLAQFKGQCCLFLRFFVVQIYISARHQESYGMTASPSTNLFMSSHHQFSTNGIAPPLPI